MRFLKRLLKGLGISIIMIFTGMFISCIFHFLMYFNPLVCFTIMGAIVIGAGYALAQ